MNDRELAWRRFEKRLAAAHAEADPPLSPEVWHGVETALSAPSAPRHRYGIWLALGALVLAAAALLLSLLPRAERPAPSPTPVVTPPAPVPPPVPVLEPPPEPSVLNTVLQTRRAVTFAIAADAARIEIEPCGGRFVNVTVLGSPHRALALSVGDGGRRVEPRFDEGAILAGGVAHILVPADTRLVVSTRAGPVVVRGLGGPLAIDTQSGDVRVDTAPRVAPMVTVTSDGGAVTWSGLCRRGCRVDVRSKTGDVTLRTPDRAAFTSGAARGESATGPVKLEELSCTDPLCSSLPLPWRQPAPGKGH